MSDKYEVGTGAFDSPLDYRDIPFEAVAGSGTLPSRYFEDISQLSVWHQRKNGSCVGHAGGKYAQHQNFLETKAVSSFSPRFLYALAKARDGYAGEGTYPRLMAKIIQEVGVATEATVPNKSELPHEEYVYNRVESKIPPLSFPEARQHKIGGYAFVSNNVDSIKRAIIEGRGIMLTVKLGSEWYTSVKGKRSWAAKDILPLRPPASTISGHAIWLYGYEDVVENGRTRTKFYILNSWGPTWGDKGTGWFYYDQYGPFIKEMITFVNIPNDVAAQVQSLPSAETFKHTFAKDIEAGTKSDEVVALQTALMIDGVFDKNLYASLLESKELGFYKKGGVTQKAVLDYQIKHKVASMSDLLSLNGRRVGPATRAKLNSQFAN